MVLHGIHKTADINLCQTGPRRFSTRPSQHHHPVPLPCHPTTHLGEELQLATEAPGAVVGPADRLVPLEAHLVDQQVREVLGSQSDLVEVLPDSPLGKGMVRGYK